MFDGGADSGMDQRPAAGDQNQSGNQEHKVPQDVSAVLVDMVQLQDFVVDRAFHQLNTPHPSRTDPK